MSARVPADPAEPMSAYDVLMTTRSVRKRLDFSRPVDLDIVRECLEIALQAPSGSNRQGWHFVVVSDSATRAALGEIYRRAVEVYVDAPNTAARLFADLPERSSVQQRVGDSVTYLGDHMGEAPVLVVPCIEVPRSGLTADNQAGLWGSVLPAAWSLALALRMRGLASAWTTLHLMFENEVAELLGLPDTVRQGLLMPVAHPLGDSFGPAPRAPLSDVLHLDRW